MAGSEKSTVAVEYVEIDPSINFASIGGQDNAISEMKKFADSIRFSPIFLSWGAVPKNGILMTGAPGGGKSTTAKALANETCATFMEISVMEIASVYVDRPLENIRKIFRIAEEESTKNHVILYCDEIDALLPSRSKNTTQHEADQRRVNSILQWMDGGLIKRRNITMIGATNFLERMDPAALRPGRFDVIVTFEPFTPDSLLTVFKIHIHKRREVNTNLVIEAFDIQDLKPYLFDCNLSGADVEEIVKRSIDRKANMHKDAILSAVGDMPITHALLDEFLLKDDLKPGPVTKADLISEIVKYVDGENNSGKKKNPESFGFSISKPKLDTGVTAIAGI